MTKPSSQKNPGGRPRSYSPDLVYGIVERLIETGTPTNSIDGSLVKNELCEIYGVKGTIRLESLDALVKDAVAEIQNERDSALVAALPDTVTAALDHWMKNARDAFAVMIAHQNTKCQTAANQQCEELRSDKRSAQRHIAELEAQIVDLQKDKQTLTKERDESLTEIASLRAEMGSLKEEADRCRGTSDVVQTVIEQLRSSGTLPALQSSKR